MPDSLHPRAAFDVREIDSYLPTYLPAASAVAAAVTLTRVSNGGGRPVFCDNTHSRARAFHNLAVKGTKQWCQVCERDFASRALHRASARCNARDATRSRELVPCCARIART